MTTEKYICDCCTAVIDPSEGYAYTTSEISRSIDYWKSQIERDVGAFGENGSTLVMIVQTIIRHGTPWILCSTCAPLINADAEVARNFAANREAPPGCGPADQMDAAIAASRAWSLCRNEWPVSVQAGGMPVIYDESKGSRCDFCRRIIYGEEKFCFLSREMYQSLLDKGVRFIRDPEPGHTDPNGQPCWFACMTCIAHQ